MNSTQSFLSPRILILGAGELASGVAHRLYGCGLRNLLLTELSSPLCVRRKVCFAEVMNSGKIEVDGVPAKQIRDLSQIEEFWDQGIIPVIRWDHEADIKTFEPDVIIDARMFKVNSSTSIHDARLVIGLGPGFTAGFNSHFVIETNRGTDLGRLIDQGMAEEDTGIPGLIEGKSIERIIRAPKSGLFQSDQLIGNRVQSGDRLGSIDGLPIHANLKGVIRGLLKPECLVDEGLKLGDIDPRGNQELCFQISDKAKSVASGVLKAIGTKMNQGRGLRTANENI